MKAAFAIIFYLFFTIPPGLSQSEEGDARIVQTLYDLLSPDDAQSSKAFDFIDQNWDESYTAPLLDLLFLSDHVRKSKKLSKLLKSKTGKKYGLYPYKWWDWTWNEPAVYDHHYADFKAKLYKTIDRRLAKIRLDEILWGGVRQDGIPPLRDPAMILPSQATYLNDDDMVFGIVINGDARAYPQRIMGWHEMVVDDIGGRRVAGVYCTLCGTMIGYDTEYKGVSYDLGTSGFLYRSNKLMYDRATQSLWNTIEGQPVVGPLVKDNITLDVHPVVTTTWANWRSTHPNTLVLDINTGHRRDYGPGVAYRQYYATDDLMFPTPTLDDRLPNKEEVLVVRTEDYATDPVAISTYFLEKHPIHHNKVNDTPFVVITDEDGGSRIYASESYKFKKYKNGTLVDDNGNTWAITDTGLTGPSGIILPQLPSHNIFWFAWYNTYPETRLVK